MTNGLQPLAALCLDGRFADKGDLGFSAFAGAALFCSCGKRGCLTHQMSPNRSFKNVDLPRAEPVL
ncbi:hypothetical protein OAH73_05290 [Planktomarina sp.]|nr:hypothetical protein [Planktomarina sp.]MDB4841967.1 hypothetical protein [Planktomarina sp.]